jgi:serine/threonine-protein kinase RsbW
LIFSITNQITSRLDHVWLARAALTGILHHIEVSETEIPLLQVAISEVINNIIEHSYHEEPGHSVQIKVNIEGPYLEIDILDDAAPLAPQEIQRMMEYENTLEDPDENWSLRGHGLQIVRKIVDSMEVGRKHDRNCITLKKRLSLLTHKGEDQSQPHYSS